MSMPRQLSSCRCTTKCTLCTLAGAVAGSAGLAQATVTYFSAIDALVFFMMTPKTATAVSVYWPLAPCGCASSIGSGGRTT